MAAADKLFEEPLRLEVSLGATELPYPDQTRMQIEMTSPFSSRKSPSRKDAELARNSRVQCLS